MKTGLSAKRRSEYADLMSIVAADGVPENTRRTVADKQNLSSAYWRYKFGDYEDGYFTNERGDGCE